MSGTSLKKQSESGQNNEHELVSTHMSNFLSKDYRELLEKAHHDGIEKFVVGAAILKDKEVLIVFRSENEDFFPGYAEMPGGGVDTGETLIDALHRETKEETGLEIVEVSGYTGGFDYLSGSGKKTRQFNFLVRPATYHIILNPHEHSHFTWISLENLEQLIKLPMTSEIRKSIEEIQSFI